MIKAKTIGFDNSGKIWKTRYSFTPTNYAYLDKKMFTCKNGSMTDELAWIHDAKDQPINNFYSNQYHSSLTASFNKDLSANKIYKSLSLEGTQNLKGGVSKFLANNTSEKSQARNAAVGTLSEKGGILYAPLGRNPRITKSNLKVAGVITGIERLYPALQEDWNEEIRYGVNPIVNGVYQSRDCLIKTNFINGFRPASSDYKVYPVKQATTFINDYLNAAGEGGYDNLFSLFSSRPSTSGKIPDGLIASPQGDVDAVNAVFELIPVINNEISNGIVYYAYVVTPNKINGGDPKGQYADIELVFGNTGTEDFELDILNLNYERTSLDHSS